MTSKTRTSTPAGRTQHDRSEREREQDGHRERGQRVGSAQLAAPSTRRWRRLGRSGKTQG